MYEELMAAVEERRVAWYDYDPACTRLDTAIAAIWLLYRRAKWGMLEELGLERKDFARAFEEFDVAYVTSDHGRLRTEGQCAELVHAYPLVLGAALTLISRYITLKKDAIREYTKVKARRNAL